MRHLRVLSGAATICVALAVNQPANAGFGLFGHHGQGAYGSYGSSGGYAGGASYGSSGGYGSSGSYAASYASYGSSGGLGSSGTYAASYGSSGGLGSSGTAHVGPLKRLAARIHAHHAAKVAARSAHGSSGGYGSSGSAAVYSASYGSSGGSTYGSSGGGYSYSGGSSGSSVPAATSYYGGGSSGGYASPAVPYESYAEPMYEGSYEGTVVEPPAPMDSVPAVPTPDPAAEASIGRDAALLTIAVPESAQVIVNGKETTSRGEVRQFMSNGLKEGFVYTYVVDVKFADGEKLASRTVKLRAGSTERLVFNEPASSSDTAAVNSAPETVVTLRVPENAVVNLAGNDTRGKGDVRTFRTRQLADGQTWDDYTIRVTLDVNGIPVTKEKTIDLLAGSDHEFTFDFDDAALASR